MTAGPSFARGNGSGEPSPSITRKPRAPATLKGKLEDFFAGVAIALMGVGDEHCALIVASNAERLAEAYDRLAQANPRVKRILEKLTSTGVYGEAIIVTLSTAIPIALHHAPADIQRKLAMFPLGGMVPAEGAGEPQTVPGPIIPDPPRDGQSPGPPATT